MRRAARLLAYVGTAGVVLGVGKLHAAAIGDYDFTGSSRFAWSLLYVGLLTVAAYGIGIPDLVRTNKAAALAAMLATTVAALVVSLAQLALGDVYLPRFVVFGTPALLIPWYVMCARLASGGRTRAEARDRVVLVAGAADSEVLRDDLDCAPERNAQLVGVMTPAEAAPNGPTSRPLVELVVEQRATVVVLARDAQVDETIVAQAAALHESGIRIRTLSLFYEEWLGKLPVAELERVSLLFDIGELHRARYGRVKRLFDVAVAAAALVPLALVTPLVLFGNLFGNRGPLLYRQDRIGRNGRIFGVVKFRTMRPDAGNGDTAWTTEDDPRITPFGALLRRTHLDELPQVITILKGDLSLVGPRPEQPRYVEELAEKIPFYQLRHLVRPGLTGWAQVKYGYAGSQSDALEKLQYEFFYLRRQGFGLDARIVGRTIRSVLGREGR